MMMADGRFLLAVAIYAGVGACLGAAVGLIVRVVAVTIGRPGSANRIGSVASGTLTWVLAGAGVGLLALVALYVAFAILGD